MLPLLGTTDTALRVSQFIALCNNLFEESVVRIEGEVANFSISRGKFVFFDLKDEEEESRVSCFMMAYNLSAPLEDGMRVVVEARPGIHQKSGQFRLSIVRIEPKGEGSVKRAFELLRAKLEKEGLFAQERKRSLPRFVRQVGIISSVDAAGFGDFYTIASQRLPGIEFILANAAVQGKEAESEICQAFEYLNSHYLLDAIVLIRGGGSNEDLHAFNSEKVARSVVASKAPVIVGVGHERDNTICDYCADVRASTPSNAAQILLPTEEEVREEVVRRLQHGQAYLQRSIQLLKEGVMYRSVAIHQRVLGVVQQRQSHVEGLLKTIDAISPLRTLQRGYTVTRNKKGTLLRSVKDAASGEVIITQFQDGKIISIIS